MTALPPDHEDGLPADPRERSTLPPEAYDTSEEPTRPDIRSPLAPKPTQQITLGDVMAALAALTGKVDDLATKVSSLDHGMIGVDAELSALRSDMRQGFEGVRLWLFGEEASARTIRTGIVHHVAAASELGKSALDRAASANDTAERALTVAHEALARTEPPHHTNGAAE